MTYNEFKIQTQSEFNDFPMKYAFSEKQLQKGLEELGVKDIKEVLSIGSGGFIRKSDKQAFFDLLNKQSDKTEEFLSKDENLKNALVYELGNHEYCITCNPQEAFDALGIDETKRTQSILKLAIAQYCKENNC